MEHSHNHNDLKQDINNSFKLGLLINVIFIIAEIRYGIKYNSMALLADAGHNFGDVLSLLLTWITLILSKKIATDRYSYGLKKTTILAALLNSIILLITIGFITWEAIIKFNTTREINSNNVIFIASVGIIINGFTAWLFTKGRNKDINIQSTFNHFMADSLISFGVVISGIIILVTNFYWIDTVVSLIIVLIIGYNTYQTLIDSINMTIDSVPKEINTKDIKDYFLNLNEVSEIHDLHIWHLSTTEIALSVHLTTTKQTDFSFISKMKYDLHAKFDIDHPTIQIELNNNCKIKC